MDEALRAYEELLRLTPDIGELGDGCAFVEVTAGKRSAGVVVVWQMERDGHFIAQPILRDEGNEPPHDFWLVDEERTDVDALVLWLACDLEGIPFEAVLAEYVRLKRLDRRTLRLELAERHGWNCHVCGRAFPKAMRNAPYDVMTPNPEFPDIEHVVPLSRGGLHLFGNLRLAHHACNLRKAASDRDIEPPILAGRLLHSHAGIT